MKVADPDPTIETFGDEIDEAIAAGGVDVEIRVVLRRLRKRGTK